MSNTSEKFQSVEDIEQLRAMLEQAEQQVMQAQKMASVGELASSITHEFNNILTTVINYAKLGLRHKDAESREKAFNKILTAAQRASKITTGMLSYSRSGGNRREPHSLQRLINDVLVLVEKDLQVHRITLDLQVEGEPHAEVNSGQLQQVLLNLIVNARQAMEPGGTLTIKARRVMEAKTVELIIQDTGKGIPADALPRIFERFYTTKLSDKNGQGGTGLGLALCKDVIESHHGRIRVESAVGHGTRFTLILPACEKPALISRAG